MTTAVQRQIRVTPAPNGTYARLIESSILPDIRGWTNDGFQEITAEQWCDSRREYRSETHAIMP